MNGDINCTNIGLCMHLMALWEPQNIKSKWQWFFNTTTYRLHNNIYLNYFIDVTHTIV